MAGATEPQPKIPGLNDPKIRGRVRVAMAREIADARARGVTVTTGTVTLIYVLADQVDHIDRSGDDRYLLPQLAGRLLEERKAANLLPPAPAEAGDDIWASFEASLNPPT